MALNFPSNLTLPYIDPDSGLKYIYNPQVGAWESAIQPPVVVASSPPADLQIPGSLYWDIEEGNLYIYYRDGDSSQWVPAVPEASVPRTFTSKTPPSPAIPGDLWWDEESGRLYVYYEEKFLADGLTPDPTPSSQWVDASPASVIPDTAPVTVAPVPPGNALVGSLWWNTVDGNLYVRFQDIDGGVQWVVSSASIGSSSSGLIKEVRGTAPVVITTPDGPDRPIVTVEAATTIEAGIVRFGTQLEIDTALSTSVALSPGTLKTGIKNYVPDATDVIIGSQRNATQAEVNAGLRDDVTVTPDTLANSTLVSGAPPGAIIMWGTSTPPVGWVELDGRSSAAYPNLVPLYPTNLPDLRAEFVRGWDHGKGVDAGRVIGSFQGQQIQAHSHNIPVLTGASPTAGGPQSVPLVGSGANIVSGSTGGTETRPRNIALMYIIKT